MTTPDAHTDAVRARSAPTLPTPIAVAEGDGIGPEITAVTLRILEAAGAKLDVRTVQVGQRAYLDGVSTGVPDSAWAAIRETGVLLKGPITTPQGGGYKSVNVTLRKGLGLYANVRPCRALTPFVPSAHPDMDLVIVRENEEDLYAGIEHRHTDEVYQCLKLVTRSGCERVIRYAFEFARANGRRRVTCMSKDNIMKLTDGLFHRVFDAVAGEYPDLAAEHQIIDIGTARVATHPGRYDVIVTMNLYGDILSDVAADVAGSVGLAGSANVGASGAMFEAIHGSAPDIAGQDAANPSGMLQAAVMMLAHLGQGEVATAVQNAWLRTLEDGLHTRDIAGDHTSEVLGTRAFADAVIERLGQAPQTLKPQSLAAFTPPPARPPERHAEKVLIGVDVFVNEGADLDPDHLAARLQRGELGEVRLLLVTNRGVKVWPGGLPETLHTDHWRCRFVGLKEPGEVPALLTRLLDAGLDVVKTENLYTFDGEPGFSLGQGQ